MGLVARVYDRPIEGRLQADVVLNVVGALGDLESRELAGLAEPHPTGAAQERARDEEGGHVPDDVGEAGLPAHEVVLVRAVGRALAVDVVLVDRDLAPLGAELLHGADRHGLPCAVPEDGRAR